MTDYLHHNSEHRMSVEIPSSTSSPNDKMTTMHKSVTMTDVHGNGSSNKHQQFDGKTIPSPVIASMREDTTQTVPSRKVTPVLAGHAPAAPTSILDAFASEAAAREKDVIRCISSDLPEVVSGEITDAAGIVIGKRAKLNALIGTGSYGAVYTCTRMINSGSFSSSSSSSCLSSSPSSEDDGELYAVKVLSKRRMKKGKTTSPADVAAAVRKEVDVMEILTHPNIVCLHDIWEDDEYHFLLLDHAEMGDTFRLVEKRPRGSSEPTCARIMAQVFSALAYLRSKNVVHRDIKPENIFLTRDGRVLLGDFGLAQVIKPLSDGTMRHLSAQCGSLTYQAPEIVVARRYGIEVDMWSAGLTMYTLLCGRDPWQRYDHTLSKDELRAKIGTAEYNSLPTHISEPAVDLISRMLCVNPDKRITPEEALSHPWMAMAKVKM